MRELEQRLQAKKEQEKQVEASSPAVEAKQALTLLITEASKYLGKVKTVRDELDNHQHPVRLAPLPIVLGPPSEEAWNSQLGSEGHNLRHQIF